MIAALVAAAAMAQPLTAADPADTECLISLARAPASAPHFKDYPAVAHGTVKRAHVQMTTPLARMFRTALRRAAAGTPDFAGDYAVAGWGCGTSCEGWAVVDPATGRVFQAASYNPTVGVHVADDEFVHYRRDSRLIAIEGSADDEHGSHEGLTYLLFTGKGFRKIAFYPKSKVCVPTPSPY